MSFLRTARRSAAIATIVAGLSTLAAPAFAGASPGASLEVTAPPAPCTKIYYKGASAHPRELRLSCSGELIKLYPSLDGQYYPAGDATHDPVAPTFVSNIRVDQAMMVNGEARVWYTNYAATDGQGHPAGYAAIRNLAAERPTSTQVMPTLG